MKRIVKYIFLCVCVVTGLAVNAQEPELTKEITVETDFVPVEQKVAKLNVLPDVFKVATPKKELAYSDWAGTVDIPYTINKFEPYGFNTRYEYSKAKGYAGIGIGSQLNILGYAGYKFIDDSEKQLKAWLQHSSTWAGKNSSPLATVDPLTQKFNDNVLGVDYTHKFTPGVLDVSGYYHLDVFNYYGANKSEEYQNLDNQSVNEFAIKAGWRNPMSARRKLTYSALLSYNHFGFSKGIGNQGDGLKENNLKLDVNAGYKFTDVIVGMDVTGDYLGYSGLSLSGDNTDDWAGLLDVTPYFYYSGNNLKVKGGVKLDFAAHAGKSARLYPDVSAEYGMLEGVAAYAKVSGGKMLNHVSDYFAECRYLAPNMALGYTDRTIDFEVGAKIGPFEGFYVRPFYGYGKFKNILAPYIGKMQIETPTGYEDEYIPVPYAFMAHSSIKGWKAGLELGYKYNDLVDLKFNLQHSPQDLEKGYYQGLDRAVTVMNIGVKVNPVKSLSVALNFDLRSGRKCYSYYGIVGEPPVVSWGETNLNNVSNLSAQVNYQVNKNISAFVNAGNLLNKQWDEYYGMGAQRINVLAGVSVLF